MPSDRPTPIYIPCDCWSADHLMRIDPDDDRPNMLTVAVVTSRNCSFWWRARWALQFVFGRDDLVFGDVIVDRSELLEAIAQQEPKQ